MVVSGSRTEQDKDDLPLSIDVITSDDIERKQANDIREAVKDIPNVSVKRAPARFSLAGTPTGRDQNSGFNVRGLEGNRVLLLTDGIRQPRSYVFSANSFGRDYFDIGLVERIEIIKGPASALYGSDGMGGLVNFITYEPQALIKPGNTFGGKASIGYSGDDNGKHVGATIAGKANDTVQWLFSANAGRSQGLENMGTNESANVDRTAPNPEKDKTLGVMGKVVVTPNADQKHTFTFEHVEKKADYNLLSGVAKPPYTAASVVGLNGFNNMDKDRLTWDGKFKVNSALADDLQGVVSYQKAGSREYISEDRFTSADRVRDTTYDENTLQLGIKADKMLRLNSSWAQKLTYGIDYTRADIKNLQTGVVPPAGETFPLKRFPDTVESSYALYVQDEFLSDFWSITPGVRFDKYKLDADQAGFNATAASLSDSAVSPKLGVLFRATPQWSVYGNYAAGFKAPNAFQVNNFFENVTAGYKTVPNPNLKPETSQNFEVGARGRLGAVKLDAAAFTGKYKDFIEDNKQVGGAGIPIVNPIIFQTVNVTRARISGFELKGDVDWGRIANGNVSTVLAYGQTKGTDTTANKPLNSIDPARFNAGLRYSTGLFDITLDATHHSAKKSSDIDSASLVTTGTQFATPAATTFDLSAQWRIRKDLRMNFAIVNLTDKKYWRWTDVRGVASSSPILDAYSQSGRHVNVSLVADF